MGATYSEQHRPFPTSGSSLTDDGSPLHSRLGLDIIMSVNNLEYRTPFVGYAHAYNTYPGHAAAPAIPTPGNFSALNTPAEWFAAQLPTVLPPDAGRFCWTLGLYITNISDVAAGASSITLDQVTVYLAPEPYSDQMSKPDVTDGIVLDLARYRVFDPTKMGAPYGVSALAPALTFVSGDAELYCFFNNSGGTTPFPVPSTSLTDGGLSRVNLIVTTKAHETIDGTGLISIAVADFEWWTEPE